MPVKRRPCSKCGVNRAEKFYKSSRARVCSTCQRKRVQVASRDVRLQETYGITEAEYQALFEAQGGRCAICGGTRRENFDVDHDHKTGVIRGLLCRRCNRRLLPAAQDQRATLINAIGYLDRPPAVDVIGERVAPAPQPRQRRRRSGRSA